MSFCMILEKDFKVKQKRFRLYIRKYFPMASLTMCWIRYMQKTEIPSPGEFSPCLHTHTQIPSSPNVYQNTIIVWASSMAYCYLWITSLFFFSVLYNNTAQEQHFLILMSGFQFHIHIRNQKPRERPSNLEKYYFQQTLDPA